MVNIFGKKKVNRPVSTEAPMESESQGEIDYIDKLSNSEEVEETPTKIEPKIEEKQEEQYREIPVCMSQAQINNLVIENNIILKQIISSMND